jgi:LPXTG-motif cell wall-anchored protein
MNCTRLAATAGATALFALTLSGTAYAHNPPPIKPKTVPVATISGQSSCPNPEQGWQVVWTISNQDSTPAHVDSTTPPSSAVGLTIAGNQSLTTAPTVTPLATPSLTMQAGLSWGDQFGSATSPVVSKPANCVAPAPPTTTKPAPPTVKPTPPKPTVKPTVPRPTVKPTTPRPTVSKPPAPPFYANCDAVRAAGKAPLFRDQPGYRPALDSDHDGIACEVTGGNPRPSPSATVAAPPSPPVAGGLGELPNTGTYTAMIAVWGGALLVVGVVLTVAFRRRSVG